jgi:hypothetical protein
LKFALKIMQTLVLGVAPLLLPACTLPVGTANGAAAVDPGPPAEGWVLYSKAKEGFAVELPSTWTQMDIDPLTVQTSIQALEEQNPALAPALRGQASVLLTGGVKFWGFDASYEVGSFNTATTINVIREPVLFDITLDSYAKRSIEELEKGYSSFLASEVYHKRVKTRAGEAEELTYDLTMSGADGVPVTQSLMQYLIVGKNAGYIATLTSDPENWYWNAPYFEQIGRSFRVVK